MASANLSSTISITSTFDDQLGAHNYRSYRDSHFDTGYAEGNAMSTHNSQTTNNYANGVSNIETLLDLHVAASGPYGYATARGWAETGYKIDLTNAGHVKLQITPTINVNANTQRSGEYAWANFFYEVTWNGVKIDNLGANLRFYHANGECRTIRCAYSNNTPLTIFVDGNVGENILFIDPSNDGDGLATAPAPLPILGTAAVFGSIRKARKFSSQLKVFRMG